MISFHFVTSLFLCCCSFDYFSTAFVAPSVAPPQKFHSRNIRRITDSYQTQDISNHGHCYTPSIHLAAPTDDDDLLIDEPLSTLNASRVLTYRASLFLVSTSIVANSAISFLDTANSFPDITVALTRTALLACAAAIFSAPWSSIPLPAGRGSVDGSAIRWVGVLPLAAVAVVYDLHAAAPVLAGCTMLVAVREIVYYGLEYKVEAAGAVVAGTAACVTQEDGLFAMWGGLLSVLAFGKIFEPLRSDWKPTFSDFLGENPME